MSQSNHILTFMRERGSITAIEALNHCDCFRLSARIHDLKEEGHKIESNMVKTMSGKMVAEYKLIKERT